MHTVVIYYKKNCISEKEINKVCIKTQLTSDSPCLVCSDTFIIISIHYVYLRVVFQAVWIARPFDK